MSQKKYYLADQVYLYPSANSSDGGAENSEENIRTITDKFAIANFVIKKRGQSYGEGKGPLDIEYDATNKGVLVHSGDCCIRGYFVSITEDYIITSVNQSLDSNSDYTVILETVVDGTNHLRADGTSLSGENKGKIECRALFCSAIKTSEVDPVNQLILGSFKTDVSARIISDSVVNNKFKYSFIDATTVLDPTSGLTIQEWTMNKINYATSHLSELNLYEDENLSATFKIEKQSDGTYHLVFYVSGAEKYDINDIEERTHVSTSGGTNAYGENGDSSTLARENHRHDRRYLIKKDSQGAKDTDPQTVLTELQVENTFTAKTVQTTGSKFVANSDGSIKGANGRFNVDTLGRLRIGNVSAITDPSVSINCEGTIKGSKVFNAVWNDYAELYKKDNPNEVVEPGTVIAKVRGKDTYAPVTDDTRRLVVGVVSESYGHLLGGDEGKTEEENLKNYYPVALSGRVYVKVVEDSLIEEGDLVFASAVRGLASSCNKYSKPCQGTVIGKALESNDGTKGKILIQVMLG